MAVDGSGNLYMTNQTTIREWNAATQQVTTPGAFQGNVTGMAMDGSGNVYVTGSGNAVEELVRAFVPAGPISETAAAGADQLLPVFPSTQSLTGVLAPSSDQNWLTITSVSSGVIHFSFTANTGSSRTAHLNVLGQQITVNQEGQPTVTSPTAVWITSTTATLGGKVTSDGGYNLTKRGVLFALTATNANPQLGGPGVTEVDDAAQTLGVFTENVTGLSAGAAYSFAAFATNSAGTSYTGPILTSNSEPQVGTAPVEAPTAGSDVDIVTTGGNWTATTNASWLHTSSSGTGNGLATFTFDANPGPTRTGTLTIAGQTLTVTQAGSTYVAGHPGDHAGLRADLPVWRGGGRFGQRLHRRYRQQRHRGVERLDPEVTTLVSSGLNGPDGVAVDGSGNVYIADTGNNAIEEWNASTQD